MKNEKDIEKKIKALKHVRLSDAEKARGREFLREYMAHKPLAVTHTHSTTRVRVSAYTFFARPMPIVAMALILFVGAGTVAAAEGALPGDPLYALKVNVTEEVRGALALSAESKAEWELERIDRRLEEASVLAVEERLTPEIEETLTKQTEEHSLAAQTYIEDAEQDRADRRERIERIASLTARLETAIATRNRLVRKDRAPRALRTSVQQASVLELSATAADSAASLEINDLPESATTAVFEVPVDESDGAAVEENTLTENDSAPKIQPAVVQEMRSIEAPSNAQATGKRDALDKRISVAKRALLRFEHRFDADNTKANELLARALDEHSAGERALQNGDVERALIHFETSLNMVLDLHDTLSNLIRDASEQQPRTDRVAPQPADTLQKIDPAPSRN